MSFDSSHTPFTGPTSSGQSAGSGSYISDAIGRGIVNPVLRVVDVDGIVRRVDVNDLLRRVDWNDLFTEGVDMNVILDQVDFDRVLERVDVDRVINRVDFNKIIDRSNLKSIIARSSSGMFSLILDTLRAQVIRIDQITQRYGRCSCCFWKSQSGKWLLPPKPIISAVRRGKDRSRDRSVRKQMYCPKKPSKLAIAVQGRNAGAVSRLLAFGLDQGLLVAIFSIVLIIVTDIAELVAENEQNTQSANDGEDTIVTESTYHVPSYVPAIIFYLLSVIYEAICLGSVGRTFGKVVLGLLVVHSHDGKPLTVSQAIYRSILINIPFLTVIGAFLSLLREDRRGLVDIVVQTTVVYAWDAHSFRLAEKEWARDMVFGDLEANTRLDSSEMEDEEESSISTASTPKRRKGGPHGRRPVKTRVLRTPVEERLNHTGSFVSHASKVSTTMEENA